MSRLNVLLKADLFYELPREHLEKLADACQEFTYSGGAIIVQEYLPSDELFIIAKGRVEIVMDPRALDEQEVGGPGPIVVATLFPGQTFGEIGLVDRGLRTASARAASDDVQLLAIKRDDLLRLCDEDNRLGYLLMRNIATDLAFKIRNTDLMVREQLLWKPK